MMFPPWYRPPPWQPAAPYEVAARIARLHGMTLADMQGRSHAPMVCAVRRKIMRALSERGLSSSAIGRVLRRDYSTVLYGLRRAG